MIALTACIMLVGVAAADSPDAGQTWTTEKSFYMASGTYNYITGTLTASPADGADWWYSNNAIVGHTDDLYLDSTSVNKHICAELFNGNKALMQRIHKIADNPSTYDNVYNYNVLSQSPAHVHITGFPGDGTYTFCVAES
jgi:hypothetical protein